VAGAVLVLGAVTLVALEGAEVGVLRTAGGDGSERTTRVWLVDEAGATWIEAADPGRPFLRDVRADANVTLERGGTRRLCRAEVLPNPAGHDHVRRLLRRRYGWADRWIGLLADTSASVAIRLTCA
jgi:hypothetical protein